MSILDAINPLNWVKAIKAALVAKYVGKPIRHGLTWLSGLLLGYHLGTPEHVQQAVDGIGALLTSDEFWAGVLGLLGIGGSVGQGVKVARDEAELKAEIADAE